jgi:hypothetical protein
MVREHCILIFIYYYFCIISGGHVIIAFMLVENSFSVIKFSPIGTTSKERAPINTKVLCADQHSSGVKLDTFILFLGKSQKQAYLVSPVSAPVVTVSIEHCF